MTRLYQTRKINAKGRRRTSLQLEPEFWGALQQIADEEQISVDELIGTRCPPDRNRPLPLPNAVRLMALMHFRRELTKSRHEVAYEQHRRRTSEVGQAIFDREKRDALDNLAERTQAEIAASGKLF